MIVDTLDRAFSENQRTRNAERCAVWRAAMFVAYDDARYTRIARQCEIFGTHKARYYHRRSIEEMRRLRVLCTSRGYRLP